MWVASGIVVGSDLAGFSLAVKDPPMLQSCNTYHPPFSSGFADEAELVLILHCLSGVKFGEFVCRPVSLPCLNRLVGMNCFGGSASSFLLSPPIFKGEFQREEEEGGGGGGNACVGMDIGSAFSELAGGEMAGGPCLDVDLFFEGSLLC
ncbi:hypothetical protein SLA2020_355450 [Shorea laevis]